LPEIDNSLDADPDAASLITNDRRWCIDKLNSWAEEIFYDLFAVSMVGPALVFACIELLDLAKISTTTTISPLTEPLEFDPRHPSDAFRLFSSARLLEQLGWWEHVSKYTSHYIDILKFVRTIPQQDYLFPCDKPQFEHMVLNTFFRIQGQVAELLAEVVKELPSGSEDYAKHETDILC
jgi:hypothetical protein